MQWISPLARAGLNIFDASKDPDAPPAPTIVWSSSINKIRFSVFSSSSIMVFIRSSNWPLYLVPATNPARSKDKIRLLWRVLGTFLSIIFCPKPSIIAVFPTPGSPINTGLFFFLLDNIWATLWISSSLPITGSSSFCRANSVISLEKWSSAGVLDFVDLDIFDSCKSIWSLSGSLLIKSRTLS